MNPFSLSTLRQLHQQYETHLSAVAVAAGFVVDSLTLRRVDLWTEHIVILSLLLVAAAAIVLMHLYNTGTLTEVSIFGIQPFAHADWWLPLVMQFAFGGLFSAFLVFYGRSGALAANWPFFLILLSLLIGNELFRKRYQRLFFNTVVLYIAVFAYAIFAVPVVVGQMGWWVFLISGVASLGIIWLFIGALQKFSPANISTLTTNWKLSIGGVFVLLNMLYLLHLIPPIPLSLTDARIAHGVQPTDINTYQLQVQQRPWYASMFGNTIIQTTPNQPIYFYSAIFAPTDFREDIVHRWQYYQDERWMTASRITYPIIGGRDGGYRGYSLKRNVFPGRWRVVVETTTGRVLGEETFQIQETKRAPVLRTIVK